MTKLTKVTIVIEGSATDITTGTITTEGEVENTEVTTVEQFPSFRAALDALAQWCQFTAQGNREELLRLILDPGYHGSS